MNFKMVIGLGKDEGKWRILLRCDSVAKIVQDILCQFTPLCLPTTTTKTIIR